MSRALLASAVAVLAACASTPERYDYSGATPAPPVYTPAGAGAPVRGQPGQVGRTREDLPRSRRQLPPSERPGIYAADDNEAPVVRLSRLMQSIPATPEGLTDAAWAKCWASAQQCLLDDARARAAKEAEFECVRWTFVTACGGLYADRGEQRAPGFAARYGDGPYDVDAFYASTRYTKERHCNKVERTDAFHALYQRLYAKCSPTWFDYRAK